MPSPLWEPPDTTLTVDSPVPASLLDTVREAIDASLLREIDVVID